MNTNATAQTDFVAPTAAGLEIVRSARSFENTWSTLIESLDANPNIRTIAQIDHAAAARDQGLTLPPNRVVIFGNPALGTPLMESSRSTALDLPQKMQVFETDDGFVWIAYNTADYLNSRHNADAATLASIAGALRSLSDTAGQIESSIPAVTTTVSAGAGIATTISANDFDTTWQRLVDAIDASPANLAFTVDHAANSGGSLAPTRLAVFGNPAIGTPLMDDQPTAGIDLPLKVVVWEDADGLVNVSATEPAWLSERHGLSVDVSAASGAVANFVRAATTTPDGSVYEPPADDADAESSTDEPAQEDDAEASTADEAVDAGTESEGDDEDEVLGKTQTNADSPPLAATGNDPAFSVAGAAMLLLGGSLVVVARRRLT